MSRYIDADNLMDEFDRCAKEYETEDFHIDLIADIVNDEPTADVRENVKGQWTDAQYPFSKCSICDCYFDTANNEANFCPICGADMRGKE